ncbi:MAG: heme o synthase [Myxococcota bacterium]|nr:heme o synthase [Myxococcota bacterium]
MTDSHSTAAPPGSSPSFLADLWSLGKPRLSSLVIFTAGGGMVLAGGEPDMARVLAGIFGTTLVVCSANSLNNYIERETDTRMDRTRTRPLPAGRMNPTIALVYGLVMLAVAVPWMALQTTPLATALALVGWVMYVLVYTPLKRRTWLSVFPGGIAGAMPPLIGWTAVTNAVSLEAFSLFLVLFMWQLPHTFAIGIYRKPEYDSAGLRTLSLDHSDSTARLHILLWTIALVAATAWTVVIGVGGPLTALGTAGLGGVFLWKAVKGVRTSGGAVWSRDLFLYSVVYLLGIFIFMAADQVL